MPGHYQGPPTPPPVPKKKKKHKDRPTAHPQDVNQPVPGSGRRSGLDTSKWGP